jgi:anti-sigma factor RsiW
VDDSLMHETSSIQQQMKGYIIRVFDGDLSQTREEAYEKHLKKKMALMHQTRKTIKLRHQDASSLLNPFTR